MAASPVRCPVCGHTYDPGGRNACGSCPLNSGCEMVCCPNCGHTTIDPAQSGLVRLLTKIFSTGGRAASSGAQSAADSPRIGGQPGLDRRPAAGRPPQDQALPGPPQRLDRIAPGERARVASFKRQLSPDRRLRLQAYGIVPGFWVEVIQQTPVTIIRIDHLELALEQELAAGILVNVGSEEGEAPAGQLPAP